LELGIWPWLGIDILVTVCYTSWVGKWDSYVSIISIKQGGKVMAGRFGTKSCSHCRREFELVRREQHLCGRDCHHAWFVEERKRALAAWRAQQRIASFFGSTIQPTAEEVDEDNQLRRTG
jgi:ribosomal protein L37AE/L43A